MLFLEVWRKRQSIGFAESSLPEREILFPFRRDQEIGSSHKKNAWYKELASWSSTPSVTTSASRSVQWDVSIYLSLDSKWEQV